MSAVDREITDAKTQSNNVRDERGDKLIQEAEDAMKQCSCFGGNQKYHDAVELFIKAGAQYKLAESCMLL